MGWLLFLLLALLIVIAFWRLALPKMAAGMVGAALLLAAAGYAWQGQPGYAGAPAKPVADESRELADAVVTLRTKMDRNFGPHKAVLTLADSFSRQGDHAMAVAAIQGALKHTPDNAELTNALAVELLLEARGQKTPAVQLAFERAEAVAGAHPGPDYFQGLIALMSGDADTAVTRWTKALERGGKPDALDAEWRSIITTQLDALKQARRSMPASAPEQKQTSGG